MKNHNYEILLEEYIEQNGKHFNESLAKKIVSTMWHEDLNKNRIEGEAVTPQEAQTLLGDMNDEKAKKCYWDAYVAANAFMHDVGKSGIPKNDVLKAAKFFWFSDDDMEDGCHKVFWYFFK